METITKKIATYLTVESVSILTQNFEDIDGVETQVGNNHRCSYTNSVSGREMIIANEPENIVAEVMEVWGDTPMVEELKFEEYAAEPTTDDIINVMLGLEG